MTRRKLTFVLQEALGWKTYGAQLRGVLARRDDIEAQIIPILHTPREILFVKRDNMRRYDRLFRWRDPIDALNGGLGEPIRSAIRRFGPSAMHFAGHRLAGAVEKAGLEAPFTVACDCTRACLDRDLPNGDWVGTDMKRESVLVQQAAHLFPMSGWAGGSLSGDYGVDPKRITVMPPSVTLANYVERTNPDDGRLPRVIFIGNDFLRKGGHMLCSWMTGPLAGRAELHIVSKDRRAAGNMPGIIFHGSVPNDRLVKELLPQMDLLCHPTQSDMSAIVVSEASAAGIPSIASAIGGITDLIVEGKTGHLLAPDDAAGFISALDRLLADRALRQAMGARALEHARQHFDADRNFNSLIDLIVGLAQESARIPQTA